MKIKAIHSPINDGKTVHKPGSPAFEIDDSEGQRLIDAKLAEKVADTITVAQLKEKAKELGIKDYAKMNKDALLDAIAEAEAQTAEELTALREQAAALEIEGYDKMTREQLIEAIAAADEE